MATINFARREIEAKVVYCGPALSGKTTNLRVLHDIVPRVQRGDLHVLDTENDRTLFFDYIPMELGEIAGFTARFKLFTVPGQKVYADTRREVLKGADAVVFVADSSPDRADANTESLADLEACLEANGLELRTLPFVVQLNKRDVPGALDAAELARQLNPRGVPVVEAVAHTRYGVLDTLYKVTEIASVRIRENLGGRSAALKLTTVERADREADQEVVADHLRRIQKVRGGEEARAEEMKRTAAAHPDDLDSFLLEFVDREEDAPPVRVTAAGADPAPRPDPTSRPARTPVVDPQRSAVDAPHAGLAAPLPPTIVERAAPRPPAATPRPVAPDPAPPRAAAPERTGAPDRPAAPAPPPRPPAAPRLPRGLGFEARVRPDAWDGAVLHEVLGIDAGPGGDPVLDVILERRGARSRHPMRLTVAEDPAPPAGPNLAVVVAVSLLVGTALGVALVKLALL